ncbi:MAG: hypothetical protein AAB403_19210 [Planctomycetota bacterium]
MSDTGNQPLPIEIQPMATGSLERVSRTVAKLVAIVTALISVAVPVTELARGYSNAQLKEVEARTQLAQQYLSRLTASDLTIDDRLMLLSALSQLEDHPLQPWAKLQRQQQTAELAVLKALGTKIQQSADLELTGQSDLSQLEAEIEVTKMKLSLANNIPDLERYRKTLSELNQKRNGLRAGADLARQLEIYKQLIEEDGRVARNVGNENPNDVKKRSDEIVSKLKGVSAVARKLATSASDGRVKIAALRLAVVSAWDVGDFTVAGDIQNDAVEICEKNGGTVFAIDRDCALIVFSALLSTHRKYFQETRPKERLYGADLMLRVARFHSDLLVRQPTGKRAKGTDDALIHVTNALHLVGCHLRPTYKLDSKSTEGLLIRRYAEFFKSIRFDVDREDEEDCSSLPYPNPIWP